MMYSLEGDAILCTDVLTDVTTLKEIINLNCIPSVQVHDTIDSRERNRDRKPQVFTRSLRTPAGYRVFKRIQKFGIDKN